MTTRQTFIIAAMLILPLHALAVPSYLTHQGRLIDSNSDPLSGSVSLTISLYEQETDGSALWTENHTVTCDNGYYSLTLGTENPLDGSTITGDTLYLGVQIDSNDEMVPRSQVTSVPYAIMAGAVQGNVVATDGFYIGDSQIIDENGVWVGDPTGLQGPEGPEGPSGTSSWTDGDQQVTTEVRVGIGTDSPTAELDVVGNAKISGTLTIGEGNIFWMGEGAGIKYNSENTAFEVTVNNGESWRELGSANRDDWWDSDYTYRQPITILNNLSAELMEGYTIEFSLDHTGLINSNRALNNGDDIRIVYNDGDTFEEVHRFSANWGASGTSISFATLYAIGASQENTNYYIYYGNSSASDPPADPMNVFMLYDDFEDGDFTSGPAWEYEVGNFSVANVGGDYGHVAKMFVYSGNNEPGLWYTGGMSWTDYEFDLDFYAESSSYPGPWVRVSNGHVSGSTGWWMEFHTGTVNTTIRPIINDNDYSWVYNTDTASTVSTGNWYHLKMTIEGNHVRCFLDGDLFKDITVSGGHVSSTGTVSLSQHTGSQNVWYDNVVVKNYVSDAPAVSFLDEESF